MKNFYLAARYPMKDQMSANAEKIVDRLGWSMCSSWVNGSEEGLSRASIANLDLSDVEKCDVFILFTFPRGTETPGGGRFVEFGYALALQKQCFVIGHYENVFCHGTAVKVYPTLEDFILDKQVR